MGQLQCISQTGNNSDKNLNRVHNHVTTILGSFIPESFDTKPPSKVCFFNDFLEELEKRAKPPRPTLPQEHQRNITAKEAKFAKRYLEYLKELEGKANIAGCHKCDPKVIPDMLARVEEKIKHFQGIKEWEDYDLESDMEWKEILQKLVKEDGDVSLDATKDVENSMENPNESTLDFNKINEEFNKALELDSSLPPSSVTAVSSGPAFGGSHEQIEIQTSTDPILTGVIMSGVVLVFLAIIAFLVMCRRSWVKAQKTDAGTTGSKAETAPLIPGVVTMDV